MNDIQAMFDEGLDAAGGSADPQVFGIFVQELTETVTNIEASLLDLEREPKNKDLVNTTFRSFHNLKGSSAMMGFNGLKEICHYSEGVLDLVRSGKLILAQHHVDVLMAALAAIRDISEIIKTQHKEGSERYFYLLHQLVEVVKEATADTQQVSSTEEKKDGKGSAKKGNEDEIVKVSREQIELLMLLVGEFISLKNRISWLKEKFGSDRKFLDICQELEIYSQKLQRNVLKLRLSSVGPMFASMRRVARATAGKVNKQVEFDYEGGDTLLDRSILDVLSEPLMHMIRNSIDHGIEKRELRLERNKPEAGRVTLKADYKSGEVHVAVTDDGGGIDAVFVKNKAVSQQLITPQQADALSHQEAINLIFLPGFSGAEAVTETSGRGVGMDVVRSTIQGVGGQVDIHTELGAGSCITMRLPLSLSIVECLSFEVGGQAYALPQLNVEEVSSLSSHAVQENMKISAGGGRILVVRDCPLPVISLAELFERPQTKTESLIQVRYGKNRLVLEVGRILGPTSILSQPLPPAFSETAPFSGITTQGDGSLLFQVDVDRLFKHVETYTVVKKKTSANRGLAGSNQEGSLMTSSDVRRMQQKIIAFKNTQYFCIPVQRARRIVFIEASQIKSLHKGAMSYVTLENETVRLIWLEKLLLSQDSPAAKVFSLLIVLFDGVPYGIPMHEFQGIKRMPENYDTSLAERGISGSTVVDGETHLLLDLPEVIKMELALAAAATKQQADSVKAKRRLRVLAAEDDKFFSSELKATFKGNDIDVVMCTDGLEAKNRLTNPKSAEEFDAVVTDIEMPNLTGLGLIRWMRATEHLKTMPVVAYTAITTEDMRKKVMSMGAHDFISKMSFEPLLRRLDAISKGQTAIALPGEFSKQEAKTFQSRIVTFQIGSSWFGLPMENIKEVSPITPSAPLPECPIWLNRVTSFRGSMIPVLNLEAFFDVPPSNSLQYEQAVIQVGDVVLAIIVSRIGEVLVESMLSPGEGVPKQQENDKKLAHFLKGVYAKDSRLISLLDPAKVTELSANANLQAELSHGELVA